MGRLFLSQFEDLGQTNGYYCCRTCRERPDHLTHIALYDELATVVESDVLEEERAIFGKVMNIVFGETEALVSDGHQSKRTLIYCVKCSRLLGWRHDETTDQAKKKMEGLHELYGEKLELWSGEVRQPIQNASADLHFI